MMQVQKCDGSRGQLFSQRAAQGRVQIARVADETCIDVTWCGTAVCPGMQAEVYACNTAHPNQEFNLNKAGGLEAQFKPGYCLDVCA